MSDPTAVPVLHMADNGVRVYASNAAALGSQVASAWVKEGNIRSIGDGKASMSTMA